MFRVLYQDWGTFKFDFLSKIRILRYILSSTLCDEFHHKKKSSGDMVQLNGFIWTISYVKWTDLPFCHFLTLIMENYSKIATQLNFVMEKWPFLGVFRTSRTKRSIFCHSEPMKTYDFLKVEFIWNHSQLKVSIFSEYRTHNNFIRRMATFCNQELEI